MSERTQIRTREMDSTALTLMSECIEPGERRKRYRLPKPFQTPVPNTSSNTAAALPSGNGSRCEPEVSERGRDGHV